MREVRSRVRPEDGGARLDHFLGRRYSYHSRCRWQALIKDGLVAVNGRKVKPSCIVNGGDEIRYMAEIREPQVETGFKIVYEDGDFIVVNKPGNLPCHPAGPFFFNTLWHLLLQHSDQVLLVNRIDRETSGLVIAARNSACAAKFSALFSAEPCRIRKEYLVLVHGVFPSKMHCRGTLVPDRGCEIRKKRVFISGSGDGETAVTDFELECSDGELSAVRAFPSTGRLHQIRATLHSVGFPVVGDKLYGLDHSIYLRFVKGIMSDEDSRKLIIGRQALHAHRISFQLAPDGKELNFEAPVPDDMGMLVEKIRKWSASIL